MAYRLGVDVGGTFTDLLLIDEANDRHLSAKVPSTANDPSLGVLHGVARICEQEGIDPRRIKSVMHGTTVATNAVLTRSGARVGLVTTRGYRQVLQIARSFVPGGLGGWVIYEKSEPLAPLELTVEADERIAADGEVIAPLGEGALRKELGRLRERGIEALTVSLVNAYANDAHERRILEIAAEELPDVLVSLSCDVLPEMQEYERTLTTVANSYVAPVVERYVRNLERELHARLGETELRILRSDGGLASAEAACKVPVNLLMSGPAGGVAGAVWIAGEAGYRNLLTFDMGGTSTDVCLVKDGQAQLRRETHVGDLTVRASSVDVRTAGAGGGSIAHVPELTRALRVGPESAGAEPGPAAYGRGGDRPTVTDAHVVLGTLPEATRLGGDMKLERALAEQAVAEVARALDLPLERAAEGIIAIVNENMCGALRLVSVEQGHDPRDFALVAFGGAGPLHANALAKLIHAWPVIVPPSPGVLCAWGDATTRMRDEASRSFIRRFSETTPEEVRGILEELGSAAGLALDGAGVPAAEQELSFEVDVRYHGQGLLLSLEFDPAELSESGLDAIGRRFDERHRQLFTFALPEDKELVNLRAVAEDRGSTLRPPRLERGRGDPADAFLERRPVFLEGSHHDAAIYDRGRLLAGDRVAGPAMVLEMDSTTLVLPGHEAEVDEHGNLLIRPASGTC